MTTEALQLRHAVIQRIRRQMISPRFQLWMRADTIQQTNPLVSPDTDAPKVLYWRNMMLLGSVLAPEPLATTNVLTGEDTTPAFYLDDPDVRNLIRTELLIDPREFLHNCHVASWAFVMNHPGAPLGTSHLPRRFYQVDKDGDFGWGVTKVPWHSEKDAEDSTIPADAVVLPDFESVSDSMRYTAIGL